MLGDSDDDDSVKDPDYESMSTSESDNSITEDELMVNKESVNKELKSMSPKRKSPNPIVQCEAETVIPAAEMPATHEYIPQMIQDDHSLIPENGRPSTGEHSQPLILEAPYSQPLCLPAHTSTRKKRSDTGSWKKNLRKKACITGQAHTDTTGRQKAVKKPQPANCGNCRFKCSDTFSAEERLTLCDEYWSLGDYTRQKDFLLANIKMYGIQRERPRGERVRKKSKTLTYSFMKNGALKRVCKKFFVNTLNIGHGQIDSAFKDLGPAGTFTGEDKRGKHVPFNQNS